MIGTRQQRIIRAAQDLIQQTYEFPDTLTIPAPSGQMTPLRTAPELALYGPHARMERVGCHLTPVMRLKRRLIRIAVGGCRAGRCT